MLSSADKSAPPPPERQASTGDTPEEMMTENQSKSREELKRIMKLICVFLLQATEAELENIFFFMVHRDAFPG